MQIEKLSIRGFGKLIQVELEFQSRLNIIFGANEAGKSTLQQAILFLLYGFYQSNKAKPQESALLKRFTPWQVDHYGGSLWYQLRDGMRFQVDRDFSDPDIPTHLYDALTGEDITNRFVTKRHGNVSFLREQIGLDKDLFEATVFVRQAEVKAIAGAEHLINEIVGILDSGSREQSARQAIEHLNREISEVGSERAQKRLLPQRKLQLEKLRSELEAQNQARLELKESILAKNEKEKLAVQEKNRSVELDYLILTKSIDQKEKQLEQLCRAGKGLEQMEEKIRALANVENFPEELREAITRRKQNRQTYDEQLEEKNQKLIELREQIEKLEPEIAPMQHFDKLYSLMPFSDFTNYASDWRQRNQELEEAQQRVDQEEVNLLKAGVDLDTLQELQKLQAVDFTRLQQDETKLKQLTEQLEEYENKIKQVEQQTWATSRARQVIILFTTVLSFLTALLSFYFEFSLGYPLAAGVLVVGMIVYHIYQKSRQKIAASVGGLEHKAQEVRREQEALAQELQKNYQRLGVVSFDQLMSRRLQNEQYWNLVRDRDYARQEREKVEFQLKKYLQAIEISEIHAEILDQVGRDYKKYHELYQQKQSFQLQQQQSEKDLLNLQGKLEDNDSALRELLVQANITATSLPAAEAEFEQLYLWKKNLNGLKKEREKYQSEISGILSTQSETEIRKELTELLHRREQLSANFPQIMGKESHKSLSQLQKEYLEIDQSRQQHEQEVSALQSRIEAILEQYRPQAEIEEELAQLQEEVQQLTDFRSTLEMAREILTEVAENYHRNVVPVLNQSVSDAIQRITNHRYSEVHINPSDLSLNLVIPEKGGKINSAEVLSLGTQEQLYLLLRVALARLFSQNMEPLPLILDDPFVHFDHQRLTNMLNFLHELDTENQVLLFTKESVIKDWCQREFSSEDFTVFDLQKLVRTVDSPK